MDEITQLAIVIISIVGNAVLGFFVLRKNPRSASHIIFTALNADLLIYAILNFLAIREANPATALFLIRICMLLAVTQVVAMFLFLQTFPNERFYLSRLSFVFLAITSLICAALALSPWLFSDVVFENGATLPIPGWGMAVYMPLILSMIVAGIVRVIHKFRSAHGLLRIQLRYIIVGLATMTGLFVSLNFFAVVFFQNSTFTSFAPLYILFFLACSAVAILKYRLLETRIIVRKGLIYSLSVISAVLLYGTAISYLESIAPLPGPILWVVGPILLLVGFEFIKRLVRNILDRYLFIDALDPSIHLDFEKRYANVQGELEEWFSNISQEIANAFGAQDVKLFLADQMNHDVVQFFPKGNARFSEDQEGVRFLSSVTEPSLLSVLVGRKGQSAAIHGFLSALQKRGDVVVPLKYYGRLLGFLLLKPKDSRRMYTLSDLQKLHALAESLTHSLNESITYSEALQKFNLPLEISRKKF